MVNKQKWNHICMNKNCHLGEDGGPKKYYACNSCIKGKPAYWKEFCCSIECFQEFMKQKEAMKAQAEQNATIQSKIETSTNIEPSVTKETDVVPDIGVKKEVPTVNDIVEKAVSSPISDMYSEQIEEMKSRYNRHRKKKTPVLQDDNDEATGN